MHREEMENISTTTHLNLHYKTNSTSLRLYSMEVYCCHVIEIQKNYLVSG